VPFDEVWLTHTSCHELEQIGSAEKKSSILVSDYETSRNVVPGPVKVKSATVKEIKNKGVTMSYQTINPTNEEKVKVFPEHTDEQLEELIARAQSTY
jgi:hypothetical protein